MHILQRAPLFAGLPTYASTLREGLIELRERVAPSGAWGLAQGPLIISCKAALGDQVLLFVCDSSDAFFELPLTKAEREYYATRFRGEVWVCSRLAPLAQLASAGVRP